jgi:hypothetical protein
VAADVTYRWVNGDPKGLLVAGSGVLLGGVVIWGIGKYLRKLRRVPVLSSFTLYLLGCIAAGIVAVFIGRLLGPALAALMGPASAPGVLNSGFVMQLLLRVHFPQR